MKKNSSQKLKIAMRDNGQIFDKLLTSENAVISLIENSIHKPHSFLLTYFNQHCYITYTNDENYRKLLNDIFHVYIDGIGVYYAHKYIKNNNLEKFNASDLNLKLLQLFSRLNLKIFIIGGKFKENEFNKKLRSLGANLVGYEQGYFDFDDIKNIAERIKKSQSEIIFLGMGVPQQEKTAAALLKYINGTKIICVGNFFEFLTGNVKRAPHFLRNSGFEWTYRLAKEPKRLWKRYILGIPLFVYSILKIKFGREHTGKK